MIISFVRRQDTNFSSASYLAAPVMIFFYLVGYAWKRGLPKKIADIDLDVRRHLSSLLI
jgi:hypothetical protein